MEQWKSLKGIVVNGDHYSINTIGKVRNNKTGKILSPQKDHKGYLNVNLCLNNKAKRNKVHRLVALAFIPNPESKPEVNHKDGVKTHCDMDNLEWVTGKENIAHAFEHNLSTVHLGSKTANAKLTEGDVINIKRLIAADTTLLRDIAKMYGVDPTTISRIKNGHNWSHLKVEGD